jgi:8-oxo-dGTP diphosphatase
VLVRTNERGRREVAVIHRPSYDDWSLPKGKLQEGETEEQAALREVQEETGFRARLGRRLGTTSYHDRFGRPKTATYWEMTPEGGRFEPSKEVDDLRWLPLPDAAQAMTYSRDRQILEGLVRQEHEAGG